MTPPPTALRLTLRTSALFLLLGLISSRVGLLLHEFAGHAAVAALLGRGLESYSLTLLGGGCVHGDSWETFPESQRLLVHLAGIGAEVLAAGLALLLRGRARRGSMLRLGLLGFAACNLVHAGYYLTAGAFDGFGDGWLLHRMLGARSQLFVGVAVLLTLLLAARLASEIARSCAWLARRGRVRRLVMLSVAVAAAGLGHATLTASEELIRSPVPRLGGGRARGRGAGLPGGRDRLPHDAGRRPVTPGVPRCDTPGGGETWGKTRPAGRRAVRGPGSP